MREVDAVGCHNLVLLPDQKSWECAPEMSLWVLSSLLQHVQVVLCGVLQGIFDGLFREAPKSLAELPHWDILELVMSHGVQQPPDCS